MLQASAYSPSHITGFFEILDTSHEETERGSLGAGVSLSKGVRTEVSLRKSKRSHIRVMINGVQTSGAMVSASVTRRYLNAIDEKLFIDINHQFAVPVGSGFGTSGAGALSLSLALNEVLELGLSRVEASQIAHAAEIESRTGLGTVIAETYGGVEVRLKPGAPGVGRILEIPFDRGMEVIVVTFGPLSTTHVLSTPWMRTRINGHAHELLWDLVDNPSTSKLMQLSREFSEGIELATLRVKNLLSLFDSLRIPASMLMIGEGVFSILPRSEARKTIAALENKLPANTFCVSSSVSPWGARVLDT